MSALRTRPSVDKAVRRRDLASPDLWDRSLQRSRERRRVAEIHRRTAPRRKGISLAVSAALLASPVVPRFASAHSGSGAGTPTQDTSGSAAARAPKLLERGDTGSAVKEAQRALGVTADGIFGPITEGAVKRFQRHQGLPLTGEVDPTTWMKLFSGNVTVLEAGTPEARAIQTAAGDEPTQPAVPASSSTNRGDSAAPAATPAAFQPAEEESPTRSDGGERRGSRDSSGERREPRRTRRSSSDDRDSTSSRPSRSNGNEPDRGSTRPASDESKDTSPSPAPAPSGGGGGGSCDGDVARPVDGTVTGVFGEDRGSRRHEGMDIAAPSGTPIKAATCGRVSEASYQGGYGNIICIRASESFTTCYAHMSRFGASVGQNVKIGEVIGYVGCTGSCTGPHVHFEVRLNGQKVDPAPYINGSKKATSARSSSTMAVSLTDSTRKTPQARAAKREQVQRQHDEAAKDPAQQPQISTPAAGGEAGGAGSAAPTDQSAPTTASTGDPAASAPAAADPSTQTPGQEADPSTGAVEDTTSAVEETTAAAVEDTTGSGAPGTDTGTVEETTGSTVEDTSSTVDETTQTDTPGTDTGADGESTSSTEEDASSTVDETTSTVEEDTSSAVDQTTGTVEEDASSTVDETTSSVEEDTSSAVDETTGTVEKATGSSDEETDASGEDSSDDQSDATGEDSSTSSSDEGSGSGSGEDSSGSDSSEDGRDSSGSEEPAGATAGG